MNGPLAGIEQLRHSDGGAAVHADGNVDPAAQVADLTAILRHAPGRRPAGDLADVPAADRPAHPTPSEQASQAREQPVQEHVVGSVGEDLGQCGVGWRCWASQASRSATPRRALRAAASRVVTLG
jgi:hypothetical protein